MVVHCAASGLQYPPLVPIWGAEAITLQPIRTGFPVLRRGAGRLRGGHASTTTSEKNTVVPTVAVLEHARRLGADAGAGLPGIDVVRVRPDIRAWANGVPLNPARIPADLADTAEVKAALRRLGENVGAGMARMAELAGMS